MLVTLAILGMLQAGCDIMYTGRGPGGPDYFEGAPYYGGHSYPYQYPYQNQRGNSYYGDKDIGIPYYLADGVMYYRIGGCYCYYRNKMRYYVKTLPEGGRYYRVQHEHDTSK
jgi:hypothetical protein